MTTEARKKEVKKVEMLAAIEKKNHPNPPTQIADVVGEKGKPEKKPHLLAGVEVFSFANESVCSSSSATYIYLLLDDKDKQLLMMLKIPHIRKTLMTDGILNPEVVAELVEWNKNDADIAAKRIKRLCFFGAIVTQSGVGWVTNPKLSGIVCLNK